MIIAELNSKNLPEEWIWANFEEIVENLDGQRVPVSRTERAKRNGQFPYYGASGIIDSIDEYLFDGDYLLIAEDGANLLSRSTPIAFEAHGKFWVNNHAHIIQCRHNIVPLKYLRYYLNSIDLAPYVSGSAQPKLNQKNLNRVPIPLPPVNEQRRIVEKIEALTAHSRKARTVLDEIPALLDQFRQSVLAAAFRGDLTADWRAQNTDVEPAEALLEHIRVDLDRRKSPKKVDASKLFDIPETWSWVSLEAIATHKSGVAFKSKDFIQEGVQVIRLGNVYKGKLDLARDPVFLPPLCLEENFSLVPGCIVVSQTGTRFKKDYGNFVLIPNHSPMLLLNQRLLAIYCHSSVDPEYIVFASKLEDYKNHFFASETGGVNQGNVGVSGVMEGPIPLAPVEEIKEVVQRIKNSFSAIDLLEELLIENQHELDQLDQSILAKAFRGQLVPQDPNDEPAAALLDRIRAERERLGSGKKRGKAKA